MIGTAAVARRVGQLRARLEAVGDLRPSVEVDSLFTELVELCCSTPPALAQAAMAGLREEAPAVRRLCASGESELETYWAERILAAADPAAELARFPYLRNYRDLVRMELGTVMALGNGAPKRVAVLGSGALPLTGLVLAADYGAKVMHVDRDLASLALGDGVTSALGLTRNVSGVLADLEQPDCAETLLAEGIGECDVVVLAALVGEDGTAKREVSRRLAAMVRPDALLLARSAVLLRSLLYPEVRAEDLQDVRVELEVHPYNDVVNSVLVGRPSAVC